MMRRVVVGLFVVAALGLQGLQPAATRAAGCSSPTPGQVVACAGQFWRDGQPILLHGLDTGGIDQVVDMNEDDFATIASWHMNVVRMRVSWAQFEREPPTDNGNGTWTHHYRTGLLPQLYDQLAWAREFGIHVFIENRCFCGNGWPTWLADPPYNSHHQQYDLSNRAGRDVFWTDYWSDDLLRQFTSDWMTNVATWLKDQDGIVGYEPLDEPDSGNLPNTNATTQTIMDEQLSLAQAVRAVDPNRVVFFTTRGSSGEGIIQADFSRWGELGNVAFDVHDFFGARWGGGMNLIPPPGDPTYGELTQNMFGFTINSGVPPYLGTTEGQARFLETFTSRLLPEGIPLFVGEFAGNSESTPMDPDILALFGTMTQAYNLEGVSWTALSYDGFHRVHNPNGSIRPWVPILCNAAAYPAVVEDCPEAP